MKHGNGRAYLLSLTVERLEDGRYLGRSPRLPGLNVQGDTIEEVLRLALRVARALIAAMRKKAVPLPRGLSAAGAPLRAILRGLRLTPGDLGRA